MVAKVGIREVATLADVSMGTVSHYLNHPARVSDEKAVRIKRAIDVLGFVRNNAGRQLRLGHSWTIAYIVPDVSNPFFATIAEGVEQRAAAAGYSVLIANTNRNRERENAYLDLFEQHQVRGMLVASHEEIEQRLSQVRLRGTPSVLVGQAAASPSQASVSIDDVAGGYLAAQHLIGMGRTRIAFAGGPMEIKQVSDRFTGAGIAVNEAADAQLEVLPMTSRTIAGGRAVAETLVRRSSRLRPDAIFAVNDLTALGMLQILSENGIRVPEDIAMIGYDDIEYVESSIIPLSSIRPPHEGFGITAVDLLLNQLGEGDADAPAQVVFPPQLVVRRSTTG